MRKKKVMAILLAGAMAVSQPCAVLATETVATEGVIPETQEALETEQAETWAMQMSEPEAANPSQVSELASPSSDVETEPAIEDTQSSVNGDLILPDGNFGTIKVTGEHAFLDGCSLNAKYIEEELNGCVAGIQDTITDGKTVTAVLPLNLAIQGEEETGLYTVRLSTSGNQLLDGTRLYHQKSDGSWEELVYGTENLDGSTSYDWLVNGILGNFVFAKVASEPQTEADNPVSPEAPSQKETANQETEASDDSDLRIDANETETQTPETETEGQKDLTVNDKLDGKPETQATETEQAPEETQPGTETGQETETAAKPETQAPAETEESETVAEPSEPETVITEGQTETEAQKELTVNDKLDDKPETQATETELASTEAQPGTETGQETEAATEPETKPESEPETQAPAETEESETITEPETAVTEGQTETELPDTETETAQETETEPKAETETEEPATDAETETESETESETETKTEALGTTFAYEDEEVRITAEVKADAGIPDTAVLQADRLEEGSDAYNAAMASVEKSVTLDENQKLLFLPYDVYFLNNGERIEPLDGKVDVKMQFKQSMFGTSPEQDETFAAHIRSDGVVEQMTNTSEEKDTVSFAVTSFSVMGPAMVTQANEEGNTGAVTPVIIDSYQTVFAGGASKRDGKNVWSPSDSVSDHSFIYRIDYVMSGTFSTDKGAFKIEVPLHILKDREGNWADTFMCPYQMESELSETDNPDFVYSVDEENNKAYIYNYAPYPTGEAGYIEIAYETNKTPLYYTDMGPSTSVPTKIYATNANSTVTAEAEADPVYIDTHATIAWTQKKVPTYYSKWQNAWGEKPADADDYVYLTWTIRSYVNKNTSPYNFTLEDTFTDLGGSVVGYRFAGESTYSDVNHIDGLTSYGDRYDYVLTRHSKEEAEKVMKDYRYEVHNDVKATVSPIDKVDPDTDATSSLDWWYEAPHYVTPNGHFWAEKYGLYGGKHIVEDSEDITDYTLTEFYAGEESSIDHIKYYTYGEGYPYPWTLGDGADGTINDALNGLYGQKKVDYEFTDDIFYLENQRLTDADYDMTSIEWSPSIQSATFNQTSYTFVPNYNVNFQEEDAVAIWARKQTEWKQVATYDLKSKAYKDVDSSYITGTDGYKINFTDGVKGVKFTCSNAYYHTLIHLYPEVSLKRTQNVITLANGEPKVRLKNQATFVVSQNGATIYSRTVDGTDYIQQVIRESEIKKDIIQTKNIKRSKRFDVTWRVMAQEKYVDNTGLHYIFQQSGKFYDLLPAGGLLNASSIVVSASGADLTPGEYTYEMVENYRGSGRTMLIVTIAEPTNSRYYLTYQTSHAYDSISDYGKNLLNSVAYETGNDKIGEGSPDDGGSITDKDVFTDLDPDTDAPKFLYEEARYAINILMAAATGLKKQVKNSTENNYSYETTVHLNEDYSYQVRLANDATTKCKDVVFFDSLENFYQKNTETQPTISSDWKGRLTGVNVNNLIYKGINPVVYLSKVDSMNIHKHHDLDETVGGKPVWVPYDTFVETYGLDKATAIAVDASLKVDGSDFVMQEKESISFDIYMKAPEEDKSEKEDAITYNNIYVTRTAIVSDGETEAEIPQFYHQDFTKAHFRVAGDVNLKKVDATDGTTPIKGITYRLSGTSDYGTEYQEERMSNKNGDMLFETVEKGTYELQEIACSDDWQLNTEVYRVTIDGKGNATINGLTKQDDAYLVMDEPRIHADLTFMKYNNVTNAAVGDAKFRLSGTSDYGNDYLMYASSNEIGRVDFENLELGTYELVETEAPSGYIKKKDAWKVKVDERGVAILYDGDTEEPKNLAGVYRVVNEPYHSIRFVKSSSYGDNIYLEGAVFSLTGVSDYGTSVDMTATSGKAEDFGLVEFTGLEPGTYILKETQAPADHDIDTKPYTVKVKKDGTFTIDGLGKIKIGGSSSGKSVDTGNTGA